MHALGKLKFTFVKIADHVSIHAERRKSIRAAVEGGGKSISHFSKHSQEDTCTRTGAMNSHDIARAVSFPVRIAAFIPAIGERKDERQVAARTSEHKN
jgi:hypothetical protein